MASCFNVCFLRQRGFSSASLLRQIRYKSNQPLFTNLEPAQIAPKHIYPLTGQKFFPDSNSPNFPKFLAGPRKDFPRALQLVNADQFDTTEWAQHCRRVLDEELPKYGVVLFRGLPFDGNQFVTFAKSLGYSSAGYEGGTGYKPGFDEESMVTIPSDHRDMNLEPHNEMAYWPHSPKKVFFYCLQAAKEGCGGLTPVSSNAEMLSKLNPRMVDKLEKKGIRYIRNFHHRDKSQIDMAFSWQQSLRTENSKEAIEMVESFGFSYKWNETDERLVYWYDLPPFVTHPQTKEKVFFNQCDTHHCSYLKVTPYFQDLVLDHDHLYPSHATYGDGEEFEPEMIQHVRETKWACSVAFQWKEGDLLVIDNMAAMHARLSYTGERKLLAYFTQD